MSRMFDLIRASAVSQHQMMSASRGALNLPAKEMVKILVYIAEHNKIFGEQARLTLASWDEASAKELVTNPSTPKEILDFWLTAKNIRPNLFPLLIENSAVSVSTLSGLATTLKGEFIDVMIESSRVRANPQLLQDLSSNHHLSGAQAARVQLLITGKLEPVAAGPEPAAEPAVAPDQPKPAGSPAHESSPAPIGAGNDDPEAESALTAFFTVHAAEIATDPDKPFQAIGGIHEEVTAHEAPKAMAVAAAAASAAPKLAPAHKKLVNPEDEKRGSVLQKIAKLDVKGRIQLAVKGTKEERSILVRDGTKLVALAVLDSPKISDGEVEKFASQKNVLEAVLRTIPMRRRFAKNYAVVRNLVFNPRTPLDVALGLVKNLLVSDLKNLSGNKEVSETVRKIGLRMFKQKVESANKT